MRVTLNFDGEMSRLVREMALNRGLSDAAAVQVLCEQGLRSQSAYRFDRLTQDGLALHYGVVAAHAVGTTFEEVRGRVRTEPLASQRHLVVYALRRRFPDISAARLGVLFGDRDHGTVLNSYNKAAALLETGHRDAVIWWQRVQVEFALADNALGVEGVAV